MFLAISHDAIPISFLSCSTILRHVALGHPRLRFPSGCHVRAVLQWLFLSIHSTWPINRLVLTLALTRLVSVLFIRSSLEMTLGHRIFLILLMQVNWNVSSFLASPSFIFHVSQPYKSTDFTNELYKCALVSPDWIIGGLPYSFQLSKCCSCLSDSARFIIISSSTLCCYYPV